LPVQFAGDTLETKTHAIEGFAMSTTFCAKILTSESVRARRDRLAESSNKITHKIGYPGPLVLMLIWTVVGSLAYARHYMNDHSAAPPSKMVFEFLTWLTCFYPWVALAHFVFKLEQRFPLRTEGWPRNLGLLITTSVPFAYLGALVTQVLYLSLHVLFREPLNGVGPWWEVSLREFAIQLVLYWTTVGGAYVIRSLIELRRREQEAARLALEKSQLETILRQAELEALRARLNPHFLFNCLQNISVLIHEDPDIAGQMLARLGVLLRTALRKDRTAETTLASEIDLTKNYVAVEELRFADRLTVLFDIAPESESALVPAFLLQPLVENAIVHGLKGVEGNGVISIRSAIKSDNLVIAVVDNGAGLPYPDPSRMEFGIGLTSTCERLEKMYPQQNSFSMRSLPEGGTEARMVLPLRFGESHGRIVGDEQTALAGR
jgi:two-component system LytT family sensor kinase